MNEKDDSMGSRDEDEEEQRPLTTADIRALLNEQEERINARHREEIRLQEERINAHQEEIRALEEEMRGLVEEATDRRFKDLERASASASASALALASCASSSPPQDATNNIAEATQNDEILPLRTDNRHLSNSLPTPNLPRRGTRARQSLLLFQNNNRNEWVSDDDDDDQGDNNDNDSSEGLVEDTFSIMMMSEPFREIPYIHPTLVQIICVVGLLGSMILFANTFSKMDSLFNALAFQNPVLYWSLVTTFWVMMSGPLSGPWQFSLFTFAFLQFLLGFMIIFDQTYMRSFSLGCRNGETCYLFNVPMGTWQGMTFAQYLTVFFALATQNDIFTSLQTLSKLRNADNVPWDRVIGKEGNRTWRLWICRILLPNVLNFIQAVVIIFTTFVVIIQSTTIVDLLKDFTALFVVSEADNIMFHIANLGYFGDDLMRKTEEVKAARWVIMEGDTTSEEGDMNVHRRWRNCSMGSCVYFTLCMVMIGGLTYFVAGQYNGRYLEKKYPKCDVLRPYMIGNRNCHDFPPFNTAECGWDGGDCPEPTKDVEGYVNCKVSLPNKIGDEKCDDWPPYNTEDCGFDGGDCINYKVAVDRYPGCVVGHPDFIRNGICNDWAPYNTSECGYDGGDCEPLQ